MARVKGLTVSASRAIKKLNAKLRLDYNHKIKKAEKSGNEKLAEKLRGEYDIKKYQAEKSAIAISKEASKTKRGVVTISAVETRIKKSLPSKTKYTEMYEQGKIGKGLDYHIPFDYRAFIYILDKARDTGIAWGYTLFVDMKLVFDDDDELYVSQKLFNAYHIDSPVSPADIESATNSLITEILNGHLLGDRKKKSGGDKKIVSVYVAGLKVHITIKGKNVA